MNESEMQSLIPVVSIEMDDEHYRLGTWKGYITAGGEFVPHDYVWYSICRHGEKVVLSTLSFKPTSDSIPSMEFVLDEHGDVGKSMMVVNGFLLRALEAKMTREPDMHVSFHNNMLNLWKIDLMMHAKVLQTILVCFEDEDDIKIIRKIIRHRDGATLEQVKSLLGRSTTTLSKVLKQSN